MNIGCVTLIRSAMGPGFVGINCSKGRGIILPGGKLEPGETFIQCARRELLEETGIHANNFRLIFQAPDTFGYYVLAFEADFVSVDGLGDEQGVTATWHSLKKSKYKAYYELLEQAYHKVNI